MKKGPELTEKLDRLLAGIKSHPDLHTKTMRFGVRIYDMMVMADGKFYYVHAAFDVHPASQAVTILSFSATEASGPH